MGIRKFDSSFLKQKISSEFLINNAKSGDGFLKLDTNTLFLRL